jgi:sulfite dehydrogenase (cytochrome) subunit A
VPGWYGTYWVKHLSQITVLSTPFHGFWMDTAYRVPDDACACVPPGSAPAATRPISRFDVRSFITSVVDGQQVQADTPIEVRGLAFDGGSGIREVLLSSDGGHSWQETTLGTDLGRYSFREWRASLRFRAGAHELKVRAINRIGQSQPIDPLWNPTGYMRNAVEIVRVTAL